MNSVPGYTPDGILKSASFKSFEQPSFTLVSINYSDKCTWWHGSTRVIGESLNPDSFGTTYDLNNSDIIKIYSLTDGENPQGIYTPSDYKVIVYKNGAPIDKEYGYENGSTAANTTGSHPDSYTIDYSSGSIHFDNDQRPASITVDYSHANTGVFRLETPANKKWRISHIELQFSVSIDEWPNPIQFILGANNQLTGFSDYPAQIRTYRGMHDIVNMANIGNTVPASGIFTADIYQIPFNYLSGFTIIPMGENITTTNTMNYMELKLKYNLPLSGSQISTASFYIFEEDYSGI